MVNAMTIMPYSEHIRCCFKANSTSEPEYIPAKVEAYFAETANLDSWYSWFKNYVTEDEQLIASKLYSDTFRKTYLSCHALLRLKLAAKLNLDPLDLSIVRGINNKPALSCDQAYFNISHTKDAFAFTIATDFHVGIDLEKVKQSINLHPIINNFFSIKEREYILDSEEESLNRFFLLWTRKEALLKALGSGIINSLSQIIVSDPVNHIKKELFDNIVDASLLNEYFMYSYQIKNYFVSIALPVESSIRFYNLNEEVFPIN